MSTEIVVRKDLSLGAWQGLGGAITEATAYNFAKLPAKKQAELIEAYYGKNGLDYCWGRVSIGSNDFCLEPYEYTKKVGLADFSVRHDEKYVLPMLRRVLARKKLKLVASPWSPPQFMKLGKWPSGVLKPWQYRNFAKYIRKWLEAYEKQGVRVDFITPQNEPRAKQIWESCVYSFPAQRKLAYKYLSRELGSSNTQILLWDHNKKDLTKVADRLVRDKCGRKAKVAGLCFHWYDGVFPDEMWRVRQKYPTILMLSSEMSCGFSPYNTDAWQKDAKLYWRELFADVNTGASAFIDWNMLLSWQGGPSWCKNYLKSPVILNERGDDYILTPIYQALKKFVHLFPAGSEVVRCEYDSRDVVAVARKTKIGYDVVVANVSEREQEVMIKLGAKKKRLTLAESEIISVMVE